MTDLTFDIGFRGLSGGLEPEDRVRVDAAIEAAGQLAETVEAMTALRTGAAVDRARAEEAANLIVSMDIATGAPGTAAAWDGQTLTVPQGAAGAPATIRVVTTQAAYDAAVPAANELVILVVPGAVA